MKNVYVIGGGASGLVAAYFAAKNGNKVTILEKNEKLGKKIYITGKGRCNITNDIPPQDFLENVIHGKKFLMGAIYSFSPQKLIDFLNSYGLVTKTERGDRVFPISDHASDVTKALEKACKEVGVTIHLNETVLDIKMEPTMSDIGNMSRIVSIKTDKTTYIPDEVIVCTGGLSYPRTGSTGDGYQFARKLGLKVIKPVPSLCGINLKDNFYKTLQGLSLKNVNLSAFNGNKLLYSKSGEFLFTHFGISGPLVLSLSGLLARIDLKNIKLYIDFKPALTKEVLDKRILRDFEKYHNKQIFNALVDLLPQKLIPVVLEQSQISPKKAVNVITKEERYRLIDALKEFPMSILSLRGFDEAIVTSGGVDLNQINPKTMQVKGIEGLRFSGEVLDLDAFTGGFNLQIAFSTGFAAGNSIE